MAFTKGHSCAIPSTERNIYFILRDGTVCISGEEYNFGHTSSTLKNHNYYIKWLHDYSSTKTTFFVTCTVQNNSAIVQDPSSLDSRFAKFLFICTYKLARSWKEILVVGRIWTHGFWVLNYSKPLPFPLLWWLAMSWDNDLLNNNYLIVTLIWKRINYGK